MFKPSHNFFTVITDILADKIPTMVWSKDHIIGVVLASRGYPGKYETGFPIQGLESLDPETLVFHFATNRKENDIVTNGGRVLLVARKANAVQVAREVLYKEICKIKYDNYYYRNDIGKRSN